MRQCGADAGMPQIIPVLSLEGDGAERDSRGGSGAYAKIRGMHDELREGKGGCALWSNRDIVGKLAVAG